MTDETTTRPKAGRLRVSRSRGALGGVLLMLGGLWAGLVPFVGPYGNLAYTPAVNTAWKWTAARGWLEVLPGGVALLGGLLLVASTDRITAILGGWLGVAAGGWLVVGPALAKPLGLSLGTPDPNQSSGIQAIEAITFFYGIGAAIVLVSALAIGRVSVHSVRDVQVAERRAAAEAERQAEEARLADEQRRFAEQQERDRIDRERAERERFEQERLAAGAGGVAAGAGAVAVAEHRDHEHDAVDERDHTGGHDGADVWPGEIRRDTPSGTSTDARTDTPTDTRPHEPVATDEPAVSSHDPFRKPVDGPAAVAPQHDAAAAPQHDIATPPQHDTAAARDDVWPGGAGASSSTPPTAPTAATAPAVPEPPAPVAEPAAAHTQPQGVWPDQVHQGTGDSAPVEDTRTEHQRRADERFAAERARIAEEHRRAQGGADGVADTQEGDGHEPAHAAPPAETAGQPTQGDYPPFYGNRE